MSVRTVIALFLLGLCLSGCADDEPASDPLSGDLDMLTISEYPNIHLSAASTEKFPAASVEGKSTTDPETGDVTAFHGSVDNFYVTFDSGWDDKWEVVYPKKIWVVATGEQVPIDVHCRWKVVGRIDFDQKNFAAHTEAQYPWRRTFEFASDMNGNFKMYFICTEGLTGREIRNFGWDISYNLRDSFVSSGWEWSKTDSCNLKKEVDPEGYGNSDGNESFDLSKVYLNDWATTLELRETIRASFDSKFLVNHRAARTQLMDAYHIDFLDAVWSTIIDVPVAPFAPLDMMDCHRLNGDGHENLPSEVSPGLVDPSSGSGSVKFDFRRSGQRVSYWFSKDLLDEDGNTLTVRIPFQDKTWHKAGNNPYKLRTDNIALRVCPAFGEERRCRSDCTVVPTLTGGSAWKCSNYIYPIFFSPFNDDTWNITQTSKLFTSYDSLNATMSYSTVPGAEEYTFVYKFYLVHISNESDPSYTSYHNAMDFSESEEHGHFGGSVIYSVGVGGPPNSGGGLFGGDGNEVPGPPGPSLEEQLKALLVATCTGQPGDVQGCSDSCNNTCSGEGADCNAGCSIVPIHVVVARWTLLSLVPMLVPFYWFGILRRKRKDFSDASGPG